MLNTIILHGRLTRDPELRRTQTGKAVTQFCVAVDRDAKNSDGSRTADFIDCVVWENLAEFVQKYFSRGQEVIVAGRLGSREWTDRDGKKHRAWEVLAHKIEFCGPRQNDDSGARYAPKTADFAELDDDSELPF